MCIAGNAGRREYLVLFGRKVQLKDCVREFQREALNTHQPAETLELLYALVVIQTGGQFSNGGRAEIGAGDAEPVRGQGVTRLRGRRRLEGRDLAWALSLSVCD